MKRTLTQERRYVGSFLRFYIPLQKQMCEKLTTFFASVSLVPMTRRCKNGCKNQIKYENMRIYFLPSCQMNLSEHHHCKSLV